MKNLTFHFFAIVLFSYFSRNATAQVSNQQPPRTFKITGTVKSCTDNSALVGATVRLNKRSLGAVTDDQGSYTILPVPAGKYTLTVSLVGIAPIESTIVLENNSPHVTINFLLCPIPVGQCGYVSKEFALRDIADGEPCLLLGSGGIVGVPWYPKDRDFQRRYKIRYIQYGCVRPSRECMLEYNEQVFQYLDKKYHGQWRIQMRPDVVQ